MTFDPPTPAQLRDIRALRQRDGIPLTNLPKTKEQAISELSKYRSSRNDYVIRNRKGSRQSPEKRYAAQRQAEINERLVQLKEDFLRREAERRARMDA